MANWKDYTTKEAVEDKDEIMIADATANANKRTPFSALWNWIAGKLASAVIAQLETQNKSIIPAINELNSKASNYIPLTGYTLGGKNFSDYLQGRDGKVTFFTFYSTPDCPFSFSQGFCIAFNSPAIFSDKIFVLVGFDRGGTKIETKQITIK